MKTFAPIALFVYNRPEHTRRTLKFLQQNLLADESRLFIFSDGPKAGDEKLVTEVRDLVKNIDGFKTVELIEREKNLGLASSIIDGVTKLCEEYGKVIVFEDDLISSPYTLQYFNDALQRYESEEKAMHIGAYMYPINDSGLPETFFLRSTSSWGWATWNRAWKSFEPDIERLMNQFDSRKKYEFEMEGAMNYWKHMRHFKAGKNNSWAIRWYASVFLKGGLSLYPSKSLIDNIGHDGTGVHSGVNDIYKVTVNRSPITQFSEDIIENRRAFNVVKSFLSNRKGSLIKRGLRYINQLLSALKR
ncbi:MAG: glycosyltransferase [Sphingobacteriaceae bacterium]|nr:glycosyltransferase [Sphingobacteriaceae bacterium]